MEEYTLQTLARFPFLTEASDYIKSLNLSLDDILDSIAYRTAWDRAKQRLRQSLEFGEVREHDAATDPEYLNELLSYVISRILVSSIKDQYLVRRYGLSEALYAYNGLKNQNTKFISSVASQFDFKPMNIKGNDLNLDISDYLKYSINLRDPNMKWKLVNRDVTNGLVKLNTTDLARLVQEAIRQKIQNELPIEVSPDLKSKVLPKIQDLVDLVKIRKQKFETKDLGKVSITRFPPCMKQLLGMTQAGENLSHVARFSIASFLHHIGLSSDDILTVFGSSPDFDVDKARYQIEHITGKISGTEYTPPSCETMKSNSICYNPDNLCHKTWMTHPLKYYRLKGKRRVPAKPKNKKT
jgi:DNA primase large subunit